MALSNQVSEQRKKKGLTQEELASLANVTVRTIQRIESGQSLPRSFTLKAIASALEIPFETFVAEEVHAKLPVAPLHADSTQTDSTQHFLYLLRLSCFSYLVIPYVHFLIPLKILKARHTLPLAVVRLAQKIIRRQVQWTVSFHLLLLLTLAYNLLQVQYGSRAYVINYLWIVLGMYLLNALLIGNGLWRTRHLFAKEPSVNY